MKHKLIGTLLLLMFASYCSVSAEPVATASNGFLTATGTTAFSATSATAETALPFYLEGPVASAPFIPSSDPLSSTLRIISSLFAIIIIAFGLSWLIQKKAGFGGNVFGKVLGILPLDNRRLIYVVDVMGKVLILGVTDSNISMLTEITDKDTLDALRLQNDRPLPGMERLFSFLKPSSTTDSGEQPAGEEATPGQAQNQRNHERLRKLNELLVKRNNPPEN